MGNRARIITKHHDLCLYLHWNGGRDSVEAFLKYSEMKGYPSPERDCYGWARLCQVIGNFFGGTDSVGIYACNDNIPDSREDNGIYVIEDWKIVDRKTSHYFHGEQHSHSLEEMLLAIDECQPERLGEEFLKAKETPRDELKIGDTVIIYDAFSDGPKKYEIYKQCPYVERDFDDVDEDYRPRKYYPLMIDRIKGNEHTDPDRHYMNKLTDKFYRVVA